MLTLLLLGVGYLFPWSLVLRYPSSCENIAEQFLDEIYWNVYSNQYKTFIYIIFLEEHQSRNLFLTAMEIEHSIRKNKHQQISHNHIYNTQLWARSAWVLQFATSRVEYWWNLEWGGMKYWCTFQWKCWVLLDYLVSTPAIVDRKMEIQYRQSELKWYLHYILHIICHFPCTTTTSLEGNSFFCSLFSAFWTCTFF